MTLPSGQISLVDLNTSLNGGAAGPIYLTSFYANGSTKSRGMSGIPLSGQIGLQGFQGKRPIPVVSGMVGKYTGESWNAGTGVLADETGSGNDTISNRGGIISVATGTTGLKYIYGGTTAGLQFPSAILPATYTLFYITRYNGGSRGRIMNGTTSNWLSMHHVGSVRRCYHEGYLYDDSFINTNVLAWCIGSDQNSLYRSNGRTFGTSGGSASTQLTINYGYWSDAGEGSDWAVYSVIVYNRTLTLQEILQMEQYLRDQYQTLIMSVNDWYSMFTRVNSGFTISQAGSDPDVQLQLGSVNAQSETSLWYSKKIQTYSSVVTEFEVYIVNGTAWGGSADGSSFNIGHTSQSFLGEGPNGPAFCIAFHLYQYSKTPGIYLYNSSGTQVGFYQVSLGNATWTPVRIIYTRSTSNTWQIYYNNTNVINYSNPSNETWVTSISGNNFGFGSRSGYWTHDFYVRRFNITIQD